MSHILITKRTNKEIIHIPEINRIINIKSSTKYKPNNIINLYSTLTPTESTNPKNKNLLISSNISNNINPTKNNIINNTNKNANNINNDIIKNNIQPKNMKYKGSSSSTNIKTNYNIFKTKKLKSTTSLINNINYLGSSIKKNINLPKKNIKNNNNIKKSKSKDKIISSFHDDKFNNIFPKSMSHNKMDFPYSNEKKLENYELLYVGSEPNLKKSVNKYSNEYKNDVKKEIKKAFKRLLTVNTDFELGSLYKIKFKYNHLTTNSNNKSKDNKNKENNFSNNKNNDIKVDINNIESNNNINSQNNIKMEKQTEINEINNEKNVKSNEIRNNYKVKQNNGLNKMSHINIINNYNINHSIRLNSISKSKSKTKNTQIKNKKKNNISKTKNNYINVNKNKEEINNKIKNKNKNKSPKNKYPEKNNNIVVLYSNNSKNKEKKMGSKSKTSNKNININININDIKTTNININNININNDERKKMINNFINPITNININSINSNMNNVINYITNINTTNLATFIKTNNYNNNLNNQKNKVYKNTKSAKDIINKGLNLKNILDIHFKNNIANNNYLDIIDSNNNLIDYTMKAKDQKDNYFSSDNNIHKTSIFTTSDNINFMNQKNKIDIIKNIKQKKLMKNISNNLINNIIKAEDAIIQKNKKNKKVLSSSCSQKNTLNSNQKIKVRRKNQGKYSNKIFNNKNKYINKNVDKFINKCITKFRLSSTSSKNLKENNNENKNTNTNKTNAKKYYSKIVINEPISPDKLVKYFYKYLKVHEVTELKKLHKKKGLVYYIGEILPRINKNEKTHIIIFNSTKNIKKLNNEDDINNQINKCLSCPQLRAQNSKEIIKICKGIENTNPNINNKFKFNDREGDYLFKKGYHLNYRYEIIGLLGKGSFGEAVQCYDHKNKEIVCIKIINSREEFYNQAMVEIKILTSISLNDENNESGNVKFYHYFNFRGHICLVFELLGQNLYEIIQLNNFNGLNLLTIRNYIIELLFSLMFLRRLKIIHCDLKPENILIVPNNNNKIKIIDFGSSCFQYEIMYSYIQSRFYRAPEVILDLGYNYEIDIWSLGCIVCELYTGTPIFPGSDEMEQINYIMKFLGIPPKYFIENSPKSGYFFNVENNEYYSELIKYTNFDNNNKKRNIEEFLGIKKNNINSSNKTNNNIVLVDNFIDFISKCLEWNPKDRITPEEGLMHPFIINNYDKEQLYRHKLKIKKMKNKTSKGIFTSREKDRDISISSNNNNFNSNSKNMQNIKTNKSFIRPPLNLSFIKNDIKINENNIIKKDNKKKNDNVEKNNLNFNSNSISGYFGNKNEKRKNHSISNYNYTHFSTNENHIYNIKNLNLNRIKNNNNNLLNIIANIDLNLRKVIKHKNKGKYLNKNKNKAYNSHFLPKKKSLGRINYKNINLLKIKK